MPTSAAIDVQSDRRMRRRRVFELSWVVGILAYGIVRFALAWSVLADESRFTVVLFGVIDFATAIPYALGTARLVTSLIDRDQQAVAKWGLVASASFLAPYLWLVWAGRDGSFPVGVYVAITVFVVCFGASAIMRVRRKVRVGSETMADD